MAGTVSIVAVEKRGTPVLVEYKEILGGAMRSWVNCIKVNEEHCAMYYWHIIVTL